LPGLTHFVNSEIGSSRIIIFFATCASVNFHYLALQHIIKSLPNTDADIYKLHGKIDQKKRSKIYSSFKKSRPNEKQETKKHLILLTTDLSSRGIDIPDVDWIIQYDPPQWSDSFVHRIGRTARAGRNGNSILFINEPELSYISFLRQKKVEINEYENKKDEEKES